MANLREVKDRVIRSIIDRQLGQGSKLSDYMLERVVGEDGVAYLQGLKSDFGRARIFRDSPGIGLWVACIYDGVAQSSISERRGLELGLVPQLVDLSEDARIKLGIRARMSLGRLEVLHQAGDQVGFTLEDAAFHRSLSVGFGSGIGIEDASDRLSIFSGSLFPDPGKREGIIGSHKSLITNVEERNLERALEVLRDQSHKVGGRSLNGVSRA